jgi:type I restriction enzyme S subunit
MNEGGDRNKLARGWVWEGQLEHCIHQNHVFRARVTDPDLDPYFLAWTANTLGGRWAERNGRQSVNLASISLTTVRLMPVIVPAPGEASLLVAALHEQLTALDRLQIAVDAALARGRALRRALLVAAFSGQLTGASSDMDRVEELAEA